MNEYINLNNENIEKEHICCAIADKKHQDGVKLKKEWIKNKLSSGHVFRKLNVNGKVFIEYEPLENAWVPIIGKNYIYVYCLWVAGSYKGKGYAKELLEYAINDAKKSGKDGICLISSKKKKPFLSEKTFFEKYGFKKVDSIDDLELLVLKFDDDNKNLPSFSENAKKMEIQSKDVTIYYSNECPYVEDCINQIKEYSAENNIKIVFEKVDTLEKAKSIPCVFNNWAIFIDGKFVSNTLLNKNSLEKLLQKK